MLPPTHLEDEEEDECGQRQYSSQILENLYLVCASLSAVGALVGLIWPHGFGVFFYDGRTDTGLQHSAAHVLVRLFAAVLCAQAWVCWSIAYPCRSQDLHILLTNVFTVSFAGILLVLIECHQRRDGTMAGFSGVLLMALLMLLTLAFLHFWRVVEVEYTVGGGQNLRMQMGEDTPLVASNNAPSLSSNQERQASAGGDSNGHNSAPPGTYDSQLHSL